MFFCSYLSEMMLKVGLIKHYLGIAAMVVVFPFTALAQTPPSFSSAPVTNGTYNTAYNYSIVTTDGIENDDRQISISGALPNGLTFTNNGNTGTGAITGSPTEIGDFPVVLTVQEVVDGSQIATQSFTITIAAQVNLSGLNVTYDGSSKPVIATTVPAGLTVDLTYDGSATAPTNAGSYAVVATVNDANYTGTASGTLVISKATATVNLSGLAVTYNGTPKPASVTTVPASLAINFTYNGSTTAPTNAGSYAVVATVNDANYTGTANGNLVISKATATVNLSGLAVTYNGTPQTASATTVPASLAVNFTYNASATAPTNAGSYAVVATVNDVNYTGTANGTLVISKATATVNLSGLAVTYNGTPRTASATTVPASLSVNFTYNGSVTAPTNAGSYAVVGTVNNINYTGTASGTLVIGKAILSATADPKTRIYGAADPTFTIVYSGFANSETSAVINTLPTAATTAIATSPVGTYPINVTGGTADNYIINNVAGILTITKATITATADPKVRTYGAANPTFTISYSGFVNSETSSVINSLPVAATTATSTSVTGTYAINVTGGSDDNYIISNANGSLTINKALLTATANDQTRIYGAVNPTLTIAYTGFVNSENSAVLDTPPVTSTAAIATSSVGTYPIDISAGVDNNYDITVVSGTLTINKATITATADAKNRTYGAADPIFTITYSGFANSETSAVIGTLPTAATIAIATSTVGTYPINVTGGTDDNYIINNVAGILTITKATITATADAKSRTYGAANPSLTISYSGFVNSETISVINSLPTASTAAVATSVVGTYPISVSGGSDDNYIISNVNGTLTISKALLTATANNQARSYGAVNPALTITYTGFVNSENSSVLDTPPVTSTLAVVTSSVGTYPIDIAAAADNNYDVTVVGGTLTINKASITATANNQNKIYGAANPALTISYGGFMNGETVSVIDTPPTTSTVATTTSPAGNYSITISGGVDNNYSFNYATGTLTIGKATLSAAADDHSRLYGAANPALTISYSGFVNGETSTVIDTQPAASTTATLTSPVGMYPITLSGGSDNNYTFSLTSGSLTVNKATLTATANNQSKVYGAGNPTLTISYTGFMNSETAAVLDSPPTTSTSATASSFVGTFPISISGGADNNYTFNYVAGTLTINKAILTTTANNQNRTYGAANPALTFGYSGFMNGDTSADIDSPPTISTTATVTSPTAAYPITLSGGTDDNYSFNLVAGTLTVTKATLTATADGKSKIYNTANPALTITYSGFVNGENSSVINSVPTASTTATLSSPVGTYAINASGGSDDNYQFSFVAGTLTISKATPSITWNPPAAITYGTLLSATQLNATANVAGTFTYTPAIGTLLNAGASQTLMVNFAPTDATNYNPVNNTPVSITVNKATPIITWPTPASITYGTLLSTTQLNATANVPGSFTYTPAVGALLNAGANQTLSVNFAPSDAANYNPVTGTQRQITVDKATPSVLWNPPSAITYGTALSTTQLNATASVAGSFSYAPGIGTVLSAGANQALSVNFTPTDASNYNAVLGTQVLITVNKATPNITWANPAAITYGTLLSATQLNATANVPGTFTYTPAIGTLLSAGTSQTLSVNFSPTDATNYNPVNNTHAFITVNKATPVITWANPAAITYGTALSSTQLNATTSVGGTFTYTPTAGTLLDAGPNQVLSVDFTPTDAANYNSVIGTQRQITVNKATPSIGWTPPSAITYGTPLSATELHATSNVPGTFNYTPGIGAILNAGANQTLSVNFTPTDAANYNSVNNTQVLITVNKATPAITWATPLPIKVNVPLSGTQLNASANVPGAFSYTPASGTSYSTEGTYTLSVNFTPTDGVNYNVVNNTQVQITVSDKDNPVITWANPSAITYGTLLSATQLNATSSVPGTFNYTPANGTLLNAGANQTLTVNFIPTDGINYNTVSKSVQINVNKAILTATASSTSRIYGASNPTLTINYSGFVNSENSGVLDTPPIATCSAIAGDNAGSTFPIIPSGGVDNNYSFNYVNGTLTINKAPLTAKADDKSRSYGLSNPTFTISYTGFVNGDDVSSITPPTASTTATATSNVNTYPITLSGGSSTNYAITLQSGVLTVNISPLILKANDLNKIYGQPNPTLTISYIGFLNGDNASSITSPSISTTATTTSGVNTYPITLSGGSALNYGLILQSGTLTVTKASLTAKADDKTKVYGQSNPANSITYTGFAGSDNASSITLPIITGPNATTTSNVGSYPITLSGGSAANYDLTLQNGALSITKAPLTAKADDAARQYGQVNPSFTITYTGFVNGDNATNVNTPPSTATTATVASNVSTYPITLSGGSATNYTLTLQSGTLTISKASLTAKADDKSRAYGQANPALTISYTGFLNGDDAGDITVPTANTAATVTTGIGSSAITLSGGSSVNYTLTLQSGTLTISKASLTITADNKSKTYGDVNPALTISYSGFVNGENSSIITIPSINTTAVTASNASTYPITLSGGSAANYNLNLVNGTLTVNKASLTAKADDKSRTYGQANPTFTITYTGFVNGETVITSGIVSPTASTTATATSNVSTYPITLNGGSSINYNFTLVNGTLTIGKAALTAKADDKTRTYGDVNPAFTITYTGFLNGDDPTNITIPTASTTATTTSAVNTYPITLSGGSSANYTLALQSGILTVSKASLVVTADNKTKNYGQVNPGLTISYTGFVNGQNSSSITIPTITTTATTLSNAGSYPISLSGGSAANYSFTLQNGTLTIDKVAITVTADNKSKAYGATNPTLTVAYSGFVNSETSSVIDVLPTATTTAVVGTSVGSYSITASGGSDNNYSFSYIPGTLTINKALLTIEADDLSQIYGATPALTISYTGFVNGDNVTTLDVAPIASTIATSASSVGTYPITASGGSDNNYDFTYTSGTLTVNKATLATTANDMTRLFGANNPVFTISYSGFVNGETANVIDSTPIASTSATASSPGGTYAITVSGGLDNNYTFSYNSGTLTVVVNNPPVLKNFQVDAEEDVRFIFDLPMFSQNIADDPGSQIVFIKVISTPVNGALQWKGTKVFAGDEIKVTANKLEDFTYLSATDYNGFDSFNWNAYDGTFLSKDPATLTIRIKGVNDPPVLSNIESEPLQYSLGDIGIAVTKKLTVNDIDNTSIFSAKVAIAENYSKGDNLSVGSSISPRIIPAFNTATGELTLTGKDSKSNYETALSQVLFSSSISGSATVSSKNLTLVVNDSTANSNVVSRIIEITEVFPELNIVNSFTPNNDGVNDVWDIVNLNLYSKIKIAIFNQEGINVFSCFTQDCKWDGKFKGQDLPVGAYIYTIDLNDGKRTYQGTVTILK